MPINREDIHIISRNSNWGEPQVQEALRQHVYHDANNWQKFLHIFFISLGIGLTTAGIIFFFAYNWDELHKFIKIGLIEGLLIVSILLVLLSKIPTNTKNIILTASSALVGVLLAVFGQVYQTGANAYDLFLSWTLFITLWVLVANYAPLWLLYIILINITLMLYKEQVAYHWSALYLFTALFAIDTFILISLMFLHKYQKGFSLPTWFTNILALVAIALATIGISAAILDSTKGLILPLIGTLLIYISGILYSLKEKSIFFLSIISLSAIIILSAFFIEQSSSMGMYLFISLFIIVCVTILIRILLSLQNKWKNDRL